MPIKDIKWKDDEGYDIHLLRGNVRTDLRPSLEFIKANGVSEDVPTYLGSNGDVTLDFRPSFKHDEDTSSSPTIYNGFGIHIEKDSGRIEVDAPPMPDPGIHNFILHVTATDSSDGEEYTTTVRVHLHNEIVDTWLSPSVLTLRPSGAPLPEQTNKRFSIKAAFNDSTVGDITHHPNIDWRPNSNVTASGFLKIDTGNGPSTSDIEIEAILPPDLKVSPGAPEIKATGHIRFAPGWGDLSPIVTDTVQIQDTWPGTINPDVVPNFLFLCDGYKTTDRPRFEAQVRSLIGLMKTSQITRPFDLLSTSMNYFQAFVPSNDHGISVLCEVYPNQDSDGNIETESDGTVKLYPLPDPEEPSGDDNWEVENLINKVGLPVPVQSTLDVNQIRAYWDDIVEGIDQDKIADRTVRYWRKFAKRTFLEEVDSTFGLAYGDYPTVSGESNNRIIGFHPRRMERSDTKNVGGTDFLGGIDPILNRLEDKNGTSLSEIWAEQPDATPSRPPSYPLIFIFSSLRWDRGVNYGRGYIAMNVEDRSEIPARAISGKPTYEIDLTGKITDDISHTRLIRGCHEVAHSFGLGDEYNEKGTLPQSQTIDRFYGNLQKHSDIEDSSTNKLDGDNIKWRWHRIRKAAIIAGPITEPSSGRFRIPLVLGQANQFAVGNTVILRKREKPGFDPLPKDTGASNFLISGQLVIKEAKDFSDQTSSGSSNTYIEVQPKTGHTFTMADAANFPKHSIVYLPVPAKESVFDENDYPFAELIAHNIRNHITDRNRALNIDPNASDFCKHDPNDIQKPVDLSVDLPFCYKNKNRIVGIYTGGKGYDCGVYHPTGTCIMRNSSGNGKEFCAVCRYLLIDIIDPYRHFLNDLDYDEIYPQT